jgi:thioredoxin 1
MIEVISSEKFKAEIFDLEKDAPLKYDGALPTIVNFYATWCGPCMMFAPVLEKIAEEFKGRINVYKMDVDVTPEVPREFSVLSVPTTLFIHPDQDETCLVSGSASIEKMKAAIAELWKIK